MNTNEQGIINAICDFPNNNLPFLAYTDLLEEQGKDEFAIKVREIANIFSTSKKYKNNNALYQYWYVFGIQKTSYYHITLHRDNIINECEYFLKIGPILFYKDCKLGFPCKNWQTW